MPTKQVRLVGSVDAIPSNVAVTAAPGSVGQRVPLPSLSTAITIVNTSAYGLEYKVNAGQWVYLGKGVGATIPGLGAAQSLFMRRIGDGSTSVSVEVTAETVPSFGYNGAMVAPAYLGTNICVLGDSIGAQESEIKDGALLLKARGAVTWALTKLGHPWNFEPSDNFAVDGYDAGDVINIKLPQLLAAHATRKYTRCLMSLGTNDTNTADAVTPRWTFEQIQANFMTIFNTLRGAGIIPVHRGVKPRGNDVAMTKAKQWNMQLTQWLFQLSLTGMIEFIDTTGVYADNSTAFGNSLAGLTYDRVHPNSAGAYLEGGVIAEYYRARGVGPALVFATSQADAFDRANNPFGVAFSNANPLLQGSTAVTAGAQPTDMLLASPAANAWSKVNRNTPNGQVRSDAQVALSAAGTYYLHDQWLGAASGGWTETQLQPGDVIEVRAKVAVAGVTNLSALQVRLAENDGAGGIAHFGMSTQDTAIAIPFVDETLYLKSPRVTIRPYSGSGQVSMFARAEAVALASPTGTVTIQALEVRKVG